MSGRRTELDLERGTISERDIDANLSNHGSVNSDEAVSSTIRLKAFILKAFHGLLKSLKTAVIKAVEPIYKALDYLLNSDEAHGVFEAFHRLLAFLVSYLAGLIGIHFQVLGISPLETHFAISLLFIMATIVYSIAYVEIKLQSQDAELPIFRSICLVSGIIAIELLVSIITSPFWLFMVNLCPILLVGVLSHSYRRISQCLYYTVQKIYELGCKTYDWLLQKFQQAASQAFSSRG